VKAQARLKVAAACATLNLPQRGRLEFRQACCCLVIDGHLGGFIARPEDPYVHRCFPLPRTNLVYSFKRTFCSVVSEKSKSGLNSSILLRRCRSEAFLSACRRRFS